MATEIGYAFFDPITRLWASFLNIVPGLFAALIVLILGYLIALIIGHAARILLEKAGLNEKIKKAKFSKSFGHTNIAGLLGDLVKWYIFIIFLQVAVDLLNLGTLSLLLDKFVSWLPNVIAAILVIIFGFFVAHYVESKMKEHSAMKGTHVGASIIKVVIVLMVIMIALRQIGIDIGLLENAFLLIIGALAVGFALALGIGLGQGMKNHSEEILKGIRKSF